MRHLARMYTPLSPPQAKFVTVESKLACVKGRGRVRELIPRIDLIPLSYLLDIVSRLSVPMCAWSLVSVTCANEELKLWPKWTVDYCFVKFSIGDSGMIVVIWM